jgi:ectoine hydroxylase-related dioxygenase (phytanoyl-CoA dioxygenase family)
MATTTEKYAPFIESDARADANELRAQLQKSGYLFFRSLIPAEEVLRVRRDVLTLCAEAGWLDPHADLMDAVAAPSQKPLKEGMPEYMPVYRKVLKTPSFHDFPLQPSLLQVAQKVLSANPLDDVLVHPRRIGRITFPNYLEAATPPHQDFHYIRGTTETYSCWVPLGECPIDLGGLAILPGSHHEGFHAHTVSSPGVGGAGVPLDDREELNWHTSDFGIGDALFFHSYTIHKAMPNLTKDRLRLSTDNRYQRTKDEVNPDSLKPHMNLDLED